MDKQYYNTVSDFELQQGGYYPQKIAFFKKNLETLKKYHKRELQILDVACNDGYLSSIYAEYGKVWGVDINEQAVAEAKKKGIQAVVGDVFEIDTLFSQRSFDVVVAGDIIEHVFDTDLFLKKIYSVLDTRGVLLLTTPNLVSLGRRVLSLLGKNPFCEYSAKQNGLNVGHIRYYTFPDIETQLQEVGFSRVVTETDTTNLPSGPIDKIITKIFPYLGREIHAKGYKL